MSPTVFRDGGFRFFFFSREETRLHVHVRSADGEAKFWLAPKIEQAANYGFQTSELRNIETLIEAHYDELVAAWKAHFGG